MKTHASRVGRLKGTQSALDLVPQFVFGYGSLMQDWLTEEHFLANITGYRRDWEATMDNSKDIAGYKYYVDASGSRINIPYVSFLNISRRVANQATVTGLLKPVSVSELLGLDVRERNYVRIDVTDSVTLVGNSRNALPRPHRIWTYTATTAARRRTQAIRDAKQQQTVAANYYQTFKAATKTLSCRQTRRQRLYFEVEKPGHLADIQPVLVTD